MRVNVKYIVKAKILSTESKKAVDRTINIGTGTLTSII
jgi:hypothetical protein